MRIKRKKSLCILYFNVLNLVLVSTVFLTKKQNNFLLNLLENQILERDDVYLVEGLG